jgi:TRAP-type C4-dicarboxylate transport system permease small subunit
MKAQRIWRTAGGIALVCCALLAWFGVDNVRADDSFVYFALYWSAFLFFLLVALYVVLLDMRYIRLQYHLGRQEIFRATLGNEEFRRALHTRLQEKAASSRMSPDE